MPSLSYLSATRKVKIESFPEIKPRRGNIEHAREAESEGSTSNLNVLRPRHPNVQDPNNRRRHQLRQAASRSGGVFEIAADASTPWNFQYVDTLGSAHYSTLPIENYTMEERIKDNKETMVRQISSSGHVLGCTLNPVSAADDGYDKQTQDEFHVHRKTTSYPIPTDSPRPRTSGYFHNGHPTALLREWRDNQISIGAKLGTSTTPDMTEVEFSREDELTGVSKSMAIRTQLDEIRNAPILAEVDQIMPRPSHLVNREVLDATQMLSGHGYDSYDIATEVLLACSPLHNIGANPHAHQAIRFLPNEHQEPISRWSASTISSGQSASDTGGRLTSSKLLSCASTPIHESVYALDTLDCSAIREQFRDSTPKEDHHAAAYEYTLYDWPKDDIQECGIVDHVDKANSLFLNEDNRSNEKSSEVRASFTSWRVRNQQHAYKLLDGDTEENN